MQRKIAMNLAKSKKQVALYNLEMSDKQVYERLLSRNSGIGLTRIRRARDFLGDEKARFERANESCERFRYLSAVDRCRCRRSGMNAGI